MSENEKQSAYEDMLDNIGAGASVSGVVSQTQFTQMFCEFLDSAELKEESFEPRELQYHIVNLVWIVKNPFRFLQTFQNIHDVTSIFYHCCQCLWG